MTEGARSNSTVLIVVLGKGKELIERATHISAASAKMFQAVNCAP